MNDIFDRVILFLCCIALYLFHADYSFAIVPVIISIVLSSLFLYYDNSDLKLYGNLIFILLCVFFPLFIIFTPLLVYDIYQSKKQYIVLAIPLILAYHIELYSTLSVSFTALFLLLSFLLKYKSNRLNKLNSEYNELRDNSVQMSLLMEQRNQNLLQNQDYEINLATLNERNRISKEIHDNVGHLLSRSLLQVGAMLVISKDETIKMGLTDLKESLSVGMDQIRNSIHNMYDESIDLYVQIDRLVKEFSFCQINYDYDIKNQPSLKLKQSLIAITKESLANIIRHSNASKVNIALREHPAMYQLIIQDNGTINSSKKSIITNAFEHQEYSDGMGLRNIFDRVKGFDGNINVNVDQGFRLFISIPKSSAS